MRYNSKNALQRHQSVDTIKWIVAFVLIVLLIGAVICLSLKIFGVFDKKEGPKDDISSDNFIIDEPVFNGVSLAFSPLNAESRYAVAAAESTEYTITATLTGRGGTEPQLVDTTLEWSIEWHGADVYWGEDSFESLGSPDVSSYVSLKTVEDTHSATVSLIKAFGRPILVKCQLKGNPDIYATCSLQYKARWETYALSFNQRSLTAMFYLYNGELKSTASNNLIVSLNSTYTYSGGDCTRTVHTVQNEAPLDVTFKKMYLSANSGFVSQYKSMLSLNTSNLTQHVFFETTGVADPPLSFTITWDILNKVFGKTLNGNSTFLSLCQKTTVIPVDLVLVLHNDVKLTMPIRFVYSSLSNPVSNVELDQSEITF